MKNQLLKMPMQEYQKHAAISRSFLVNMLRSPAHAIYNRDNKDEPTEAMILGSAAHTLLLEPQLFDTEYLVADIDRRTTIGKAADAEAKAKGLRVLKTAQKAQIDAMIAQVKAHKGANKILQNGQPEQSIFWTDADTGIECKCRNDFTRQEGIIVDYKSTLDASPESFVKTILNNFYHVQAAYYLDGLATTNHPSVAFCFIAGEKEPPYSVGVYTITDDYIELGRKLYKKALALYAKCLKENYFPAYSEEIIELAPPRWALTKEEYNND